MFLFWKNKNNASYKITYLPGAVINQKENEHLKFVSLSTSVCFLLACLIGLNREQVMDHLLSLKIRHIQAYEGDSNLAVINELVRWVQRLLCLLPTHCL